MKEKELPSQPGEVFYIEIFLEQIESVGWNSFFWGKNPLFLSGDLFFSSIYQCQSRTQLKITAAQTKFCLLAGQGKRSQTVLKYQRIIWGQTHVLR